MAGRGVVLVLTCALAVGSCSLNDPPGGDGRMSIATGGSGGVYQVYGGGVAEMLSSNGHATTAETTSAFRRTTQRVVEGCGSESMVSGSPSGPIT